MKWKAELVTHKNQKRIAVFFEREVTAIERIKKLPGAKWSRTLNAWHLPNNKENRERFKIPEVSVIMPDKTEHLERFKNYLLLKRYSDNTIKTYTEALKSFFIFYNQKPISNITNADVSNYMTNYILKNNLSSSYQNQVINAIKLYFKITRDTLIVTEKIYRPKGEKLLPNVLSKEEVKKILNAHSNIKHKTMLCMIYSCGLRRGELLNLKPADIDSKRNLVIIRQAKGKKDRVAPLSAGILNMLRDYFKAYKPLNWLFEGQVKGEKYDERSLTFVHFPEFGPFKS